jgi:hypothetical protein
MGITAIPRDPFQLGNSHDGERRANDSLWEHRIYRD